MALLGLVPTRIPAQRALSVDPLVLLARSNHSLGGSSLFAPCEKKPRCPRQVHPTAASSYLARESPAVPARFTPQQLHNLQKKPAPLPQGSPQSSFLAPCEKKPPLSPPGSSSFTTCQRKPPLSPQGSPHSKQLNLTPCPARTTKCRTSTPQYCLCTKTGRMPRSLLRPEVRAKPLSDPRTLRSFVRIGFLPMFSAFSCNARAVSCTIYLRQLPPPNLRHLFCAR
jgi:hypothetical protein